MVKGTRGVSNVFWTFLTKSVGGNVNLGGGGEAPEGLTPSPDKSNTEHA